MRLLAALAVFAASVAAIPVSATAQSAPAPLNPADCSNGTWVDNPSANPGLVADCTALVAIRNHFMSNPANTGIDYNTPWRGTLLSTQSEYRFLAPEHTGSWVSYGEYGDENYREIRRLEGLPSSGRVVELDLSDSDLLWRPRLLKKLAGSIPAELGNLTALINLELSGNQLTGDIPTQLGNLTNLKVLYLHNNWLTGTIPTQLANLTNLKVLYLHNNWRLTGTIPTQLGNLTNLTSLALYNNQLTGTIPAELGNLTALINLELGGNQLTGTIPTQLGNLTNLTSLALYNNQLTGTIPTQLGNLTNLKVLYLHNNWLTGTIPTQLGNLTNLTWLRLDGNQLTGTIPTQLANLTNLVYLTLQDNQLTGTIPTQLANLTNLEYLTLQDNQLTGTIPAELGNLTALINLELGGNQLTGTIPSELGNLTNLKVLYLHNNWLTGTIPTQLANLTNLTNHLARLYLGGNRLSGEIPSSLQVSDRFRFCPNLLTGALPSQLRGGVSDSFTGDPDDISSYCNFKGSFSDDEGNVHEDNIEQIAQWGITTGCDKRRFCPSKTVNRAQMSAFLYRAVTHLSGTPDPGGEVQLSDVADDAWYRTHARWAVNNGVIRAPGGRFNPHGDVTRSDMAEMLVAAFNHLSAPAQPQGLFSDTTDLPDTAVRAIEGIHAAEVTTGCATNPPRYCPAETVTRAQMASFLTRAIQTADANP